MPGRARPRGHRRSPRPGRSSPLRANRDKRLSPRSDARACARASAPPSDQANSYGRMSLSLIVTSSAPPGYAESCGRGLAKFQGRTDLVPVPDDDAVCRESRRAAVVPSQKMLLYHLEGDGGRGRAGSGKFDHHLGRASLCVLDGQRDAQQNGRGPLIAAANSAKFGAVPKIAGAGSGDCGTRTVGSTGCKRQRAPISAAESP